VGVTAGVETEQLASKTPKTIDSKPSQLIIAILVISHWELGIGHWALGNGQWAMGNVPLSSLSKIQTG
jgi:hypothetical protein